MWRYSSIFVALVVMQTQPAGGAIVIESGTLSHENSDGFFYGGPLDDVAYGSGGVNWSGLESPIRYDATFGNYTNVVDRADCPIPGNCHYENWMEMWYEDADATFRLSSSGVLQVTSAPAGNLGLQISNQATGAVLHDAAMDTLPPTILLPPGTWNFEVDDISAGVSTNSSNNYSDPDTGSYDNSSYSSYDTTGWVEIIETVLTGPVVTIGDVDPGGTGIQSSPWDLGSPSELLVGDDGKGTLEISAGGKVMNEIGSIGEEAGDVGEATVSGIDAHWENSGNLFVGYRGAGSLNIEAQGRVSNEIGYIGTFSPGDGLVTVTGENARWENEKILYVGYWANGSLNITNGGLVTSMGGYISRYSNATGVVTVRGADSVWNPQTSLRIAYKGNGSLVIEDGGTVTNINGYIGEGSTAVGAATVRGQGSLWNNSGNLEVGDKGTATLTIEDGGEVIVGDTTTIGSDGNVNLTGGRFEFGKMSMAEFSVVHATGGALAGNVLLAGVNDVSLLTALQNSVADLNDVVADNSGLLHGSARLTSSLNNRSDGEVRLLAGSWLRVEGSGNLNAGEINNFGGMIEFTQDMTNQGGGFIAGRGQFMAHGGWSNSGVMAFSGGFTDILGDVVNDTGGQIVTSGGATTTFFDDLEHNGTEIRTSADSRTVFLGAYSGSGNHTGEGDVFYEGDLRPGNSPAAVSYGGNVHLGPTARLESELLGTAAGNEHDQLQIAGTIHLDGTLDLVPLAPYADVATRGTADDFVIITAGSRSGTFSAIQYDNSPLTADFGPDASGSFRSHAGSGLFRSITYTATTVELKNLLAFGGDADGDGAIDISDFNSLASNFDPGGSDLAWTDGDFDSDGDIDISDFNSLASNFSPGGYGTAAIPEPSTMPLVILALALVSCFRRLSTCRC